ncbi:sugar transferase [Lentilactobacillus parafarraginis]|uniref:Sugar transferase n=1 Tax=Lentilactobacillus parafarraginis DSM 18390 = JCM 14109 TaxID=1423786 RepID=A0A0R1YFI9_9LACO|nr:sugar transferase [Lentilactobacillus parafarraginis]KRM41191.1 sugar transferase [Lentilactobacillus parafarraginis DSM 18390 = JCM 14109]
MQTEGHGRGNYHSLASSNTISKDQIKKRIFYHFFKRFFDELLSISAIILLIPVFVVTSILIKIEDPHGPIFYSQIRIGKNNRPFKMYKFRSMVINADERLKTLLDQNDVEGAMFKMKSDPRVTKVGRIIRKYSIDELPQLINVVKGDMSLVGPRPPLRREVKEYTEYDKQRLLVIPGCTGLWQVGERNNVGFHEMVELDLKYIREAGILLDFYILIRTIIIMIRPNNAY